MPACPSCGAEHPADARFCSSCGAALHIACPNCGTELAASAAFCSACGTPLRDGVRRASAAAGAEERRVVSLLFADLAGSTALGGRLDPEDVRAVQQELYGLVAERVEAFGGVTEKFAGDAVLVVFGIPQAHEDDATRATLAALAVRDAFGEFAAGVRARHGGDVGVRIGVNTGEVVSGREAASRGELMVSGDAVNVAARLQQAAVPGEVLVGERTEAAARRTVEFGEPRTVAAKGKDGGLVALPALRPIGDPVERGIPGLHSPMIGRDDELALLSTLARRVRRERVPQLVTLFGAAGVGKSRLLREFVATQPDALVLVGRCLPYGDAVTWWPLAEIVKDHAGILESDPAAIARVKLAAALMPLGDETLLDAVSYTIGIEEPGSRIAQLDGLDVRRALVRAWTRYLGELGRRGPALVVFEDIHWASPPLLDLIEHVSDGLADSEVMILCPSRPELLDDRPSWGAGKRNATAMTLSPLRAEDADVLISALLDVDQIGEALHRRIRERAEGNPFYTEEILRMLIDGGALAERGGRWVAARRLEELPIPDSVHGVIAARIDLLGADERRVLRECAVVGRRFWPGAVGADPAVLASLARRELVSQRGHSTVESEHEYTFKHALTREVAYAALPRAERRRLHVQVAEWIEQMSSDRGLEVADLVAHHYAEAVDSGEDDPAVRARALDALIAAGSAAVRRSAGEPARANLRRALDLATDDHDRGRVELELGQADLWLNEVDEAIALLESARRRFEGLGDGPLLADVLAQLSRGYWYRARQSDALEAATGAVRVLEGLDETPALARALARRSQIEMLAALPEAVPHAAEAIDVARRIGDRYSEANAMINLASAEMFRGDTASEVIQRFIQAARIAVECGADEEAIRARVNYLWTAAPLIPISELLEGLERSMVVRDSMMLISGYHLYFDLSYHLFVHMPSGRWDEIDVDGGRDAAARQSTTLMLWLQLRASLALARGQVERAEPLIEEALMWSDRTSEPQRITPIRCLAAKLAAVQGRAEEALHHLGVARENQRGRLSVGFAWELGLTAPRVMKRIGAGDELEGLWSEMRHELSPDESSGLQPAAAAALFQGVVASHHGRTDEALGALRRVVELEQLREAPYDEACARLDLADALEAAGQEDAAVVEREGAAQVLRPLGVVNPL
ncbi:MAG: ATP-binding protein [Gaiellales bacterium]